MELIFENKKLIIPSVIPLILSVFNCYIYFRMESWIGGIILLLWRVVITALVLYVLSFWTLMTHYYKTYGNNMNRFVWALYMLIKCCKATLMVNFGMVMICATVLGIAMMICLAIYIVSGFIKLIS